PRRGGCDSGVGDGLDADVPRAVQDGDVHRTLPPCGDGAPARGAGWRGLRARYGPVQVEGSADEAAGGEWEVTRGLPEGQGAAPCQWSSPGSKKTRSPGRITSMGPPHRWQRPTPSVT